MKFSNSVRVLFYVMLFALVAGSAHAQEYWDSFNNGPEGGSVDEVVLWGDTGVGRGFQNYCTEDDGISWRFCYQFTFSSIATEPDGRGWATASRHGMYFTSDKGATWSQISFPLSSGMYDVISTTPGHRVAMAEYPTGAHYLYESKDPTSGAWKKAAGVGLPATFAGTDLVYNAATNTLILNGSDDSQPNVFNYRTTDIGATWQKMPTVGIPADETLGYGYGYLYCTRSGVLFVMSRKIVGTEVHWNTYRSLDNGDTWTAVQSGFPPFACMNYVAERDDSVLFATAYGEATSGDPRWYSVYRSTDRGANWTELPNVGLPTNYSYGIFITSRGTMIATGNSGNPGGIYRSNDSGATWTTSAQGFTGAFTVSVAIDSAINIFVCSPANGVFRSPAGGSWTRLDNGMPGWGWKNIRVRRDQTVFVADTISGLFRSTDLGDSWTSISNGLSNLHNRAFDISPLGTLIVCTDDGIFRSTTSGDLWTAASSTIPPGIPVMQLGVRNDGLIIAATSNGPYASTDDGNTWVVHTGGLSDPACYSVGFCKDGTVLLGNAKTIVRSTDHGVTWTPSGGGLLPNAGDNSWYFRSFATRANGRIVAGRNGDSVFLYVSSDNGRTWVDDRTYHFENFRGLTNYAYAVDRYDNLVAATNYGVWFTSGSLNAVVEIPSNPSGVKLVCTGPNPCSDQTHISFTVPASSFATLSLVDCLGRTVWKSAQEIFLAGTHAIQVSASNLRAGLYHFMLHSSWGVRSATVCVVH